MDNKERRTGSLAVFFDNLQIVDKQQQFVSRQL